jgi:hypothetical protein
MMCKNQPFVNNLKLTVARKDTHSSHDRTQISESEPEKITLKYFNKYTKKNLLSKYQPLRTRLSASEILKANMSLNKLKTTISSIKSDMKNL